MSIRVYQLFWCDLRATYLGASQLAGSPCVRELQVVSNIYKPYTSHRPEDMFTTGFFPSKTHGKSHQEVSKLRQAPPSSGNLAVLTPLEGESLQPSNLSAGATNYLNVFFQARQQAIQVPVVAVVEYPLVMTTCLLLKMVIFIVDLAMNNGDFPWFSMVMLVYWRVNHPQNLFFQCHQCHK